MPGTQPKPACLCDAEWDVDIDQVQCCKCGFSYVPRDVQAGQGATSADLARAALVSAHGRRGKRDLLRRPSPRLS